MLARYNLTEEQYDDMLLAQDNKCFICSSTFSDNNKPKIDHNHSTGKVRKILCNRCNIFVERTENINDYFEYIKKQK